MSDFDPYYKWLGIPLEEQPPTHYRLLGIQLLEQNAEVIEAAANRQMAYLQELSAGDAHIDEAQRLLGEVAKARVCLLNTESKAAYDAEIASTLDSLPEAEEESADAQQPLAGSIETMTSGGSRRPATASGGKGRKKSSSRRTKRSTPSKSGSSSSNKSSSMQVKIIAAAVPAVLGLIVLIVLLSSGGGGKKPESKTASNKSAESSSSRANKGNKKTSKKLPAIKLLRTTLLIPRNWQIYR